MTFWDFVNQHWFLVGIVLFLIISAISEAIAERRKHTELRREISAAKAENDRLEKLFSQMLAATAEKGTTATQAQQWLDDHSRLLDELNRVFAATFEHVPDALRADVAEAQAALRLRRRSS